MKLGSDLDPLRVDLLPADVWPLAGRLGMTIAPGKKAPGMSGEWDRDLEKDVARLREVHDASLLVCLVTHEELDALGIPALGDVCARRAIGFLHFPVRDGGVPTDMVAFAGVVRAVVDAARKGDNVVVHCRGGLGRTGTVVACALVALGRSPDDAIRAVRAARRGAIENALQERCVQAFAELRP